MFIKLLLQLISSSEKDGAPEWSGWNTCQGRFQGHTPSPKNHIIYHPLIMAKLSESSTVYTSIVKAETITKAPGQEYTVFTGDQQLFKVTWDNPEV